MATTNTRDRNRRTRSGGTSHAAPPVTTPPTKATSARILSEDRTTRRRKYTIFWPGREDEIKVVPAADILEYVIMGHFRSFRVGVEAERSRQKMAENLEAANQKEAEKEWMAAKKKVQESWEREQAAAVGDALDAESSSDSDIQCYLKPKGSTKKTTTRVIKRHQGKDINPKDNKARRLKKRRKALAAARLAKKNKLQSTDNSSDVLVPEQTPPTKRTTRLSLKTQASSPLETEPKERTKLEGLDDITSIRRVRPTSDERRNQTLEKRTTA